VCLVGSGSVFGKILTVKSVFNLCVNGRGGQRPTRANYPSVTFLIDTMSYTEHAICDVEMDGLTFDAAFDGGNASKVEQIGDDEFCVWTRRDCEGTTYENGCRVT
jgi:hypothetical protein